VYKDDYKTNYEWILPAASTWWENAMIRPIDRTVVQTMDVDEVLIWRNLNARRNILISGDAGSGKSHLMSRFIQHATKSNLNFAVTAPTGVAAMHVGGETLHRRLGLGLAAESPTVLWEKISSNRRRHEKTWKFLTQTDLLVIDEISMVHPQFLTKVDYLFRKARNPSVAFGGALLLMVGDFKQLGAVIKRDEDADAIRTVRHTDAWQAMNISRIILKRSYRQAPGPWLDLLNHVGRGYLTREDRELLDERRNVEFPEETVELNGKSHILHPVEMFSHLDTADKTNQSKLTALVEAGAKLKRFAPIVRCGTREQVKEVDDNERKDATALTHDEAKLRSMFPIYDLNVCVGAQVMMRCNSLIDLGICNGTTGIVTAVHDHEIRVLFFQDGKPRKENIGLSRHEFKASVGRSMQVCLFQFPLSLAWALSIHKCQGLTLDRARVHAGQCFTAGQLYVALSRLKTIDGLCLPEFNEASIIADEDAVEYESKEYIDPEAPVEAEAEAEDEAEANDEDMHS